MKSFFLMVCLIMVPISAWPQAKVKPIVITLVTGETLKGELVKVDTEEVHFNVKNILQIVPLAEVASIAFPTAPPVKEEKPPAADAAPVSTNSLPHGVEEMGKNGVGRPTILYREKASYTEKARKNKVEGAVVLSVIFSADAKITNIRVVRGLPDGLNEAAIEAAKNIKFEPAKKDGLPVSVRGNLEFTFNLYWWMPPPEPLSPANQTVFNHFPRKTIAQWKPVPQAVKYMIVIEMGDQEGKQWQMGEQKYVTDTQYAFDFYGAQPGRWQVWAIDALGREGSKSTWQYFRYTK